MSENGMRGEWQGANPALRGLRIAGLVVLGVVGAALFALVFGWFVMLLWNWLMPAIFNLGTITYWQAFGIVILAKLVFGNAGAGPGGRHFGKRHRHGCHDEWGGGDKWRHWRDYWNEEGRDAFERYVQRGKPAQGPEPGK